MPRQNFISDKLLDMGDRLKQNYAAANGQEPTPPPEKSIPMPCRPAGDDLENARLGRDLAERIVRDLAKVNAELKENELRRTELEQFATSLHEIVASQASLSANPDTRRELEQLRIKYFAAAGRVEDLSGVKFTATSTEAVGPGGCEWKKSLPIALAVVAGAVLVALSILIAFR